MSNPPKYWDSLDMAPKAINQNPLRFNPLGLLRRKLVSSVDATTKWLKIFMINSLTAQTVIKRFVELIARFGLARTITIGSAKRFSGVEFESYDKKIRQCTLE